MALSISGKGFFLGRSEVEEVLKLTDEEVGLIKWSPDGKFLAYETGDQITLLDMNTGVKTKLNLTGGLDWHPGGQFLVVGSAGKLVLIDVSTGKEIHQTKITSNSGLISYVSSSPDGRNVAYLESIYLYIVELIFNQDGLPTKFGDAVYLSDKVEGQIWRVGWAPADERLAVLIAPWPGNPYVGFLSVDGILRSQIRTPDFVLNEFNWSPDGRYVAILGFESKIIENRLMVFDYQTKALSVVDRGGSFGCFDWTGTNKKLGYAHISDFGTKSEIILSDTAGIQKQVLNVSELLGEEWDSACVKFRPGREISTVALPTSTPDPLCTAWSRLKVGGYARMVDTVPNRVRSAPQKGDNLIGSIGSGTVVKVLDGPVCSDGLVYWLVESDCILGVSGWTAEGDGQAYWLEPVD